MTIHLNDGEFIVITPSTTSDGPSATARPAARQAATRADQHFSTTTKNHQILPTKSASRLKRDHARMASWVGAQQ